MSLNSEEQLVSRLQNFMPLGSDVELGPGDDCAIVERNGSSFLFKTDCVVEAVHFDKSCPPHKVGRKALARVLSDIAAMAGKPGPAVVTAGLSEQLGAEWLLEAYRGLQALATKHSVSIVGGETTKVPGNGFLSVTMLGEVVQRPVLRSGGSNGDLLLVTGQLGGSLKSGWHLDFHPRLAEARWLADHYRPTAMMDLSDGLAADLPRLAAASNTGYLIDTEALPLHPGCSTEQALTDGEDYELLFSIPQGMGNQLEQAWADQFPDLQLTSIGELRDGEATGLGQGYDHLRQQ